MTKPNFLVCRSLEERRQILQQHSSSRTMGEVFGGTTAEVAAVALCVPCAVVDFTVLTMYKVPKGLCRNVMRRRRMKKRLNGNGNVGDLDEELSMHPAVVAAAERFVIPEADEDVLALEDEMWERFNEGGFMRADSETN